MIDRAVVPRRATWPVATARQAGLLAEAAALLHKGSVVAIPTDTVYGLAALPGRDEALDLIYALKQRPREKAIALLVAGPGDLARLTSDPPPVALRLAHRFWPGGLTLILRSAADPSTTVGLRMPAHEVALGLIAAAGSSLATTSANLASAASPRSADEVLAQLPVGYPLLIDAGPCQAGVDSTVLDLTREPPRILRAGPIDRAALEAILGDLEG